MTKQTKRLTMILVGVLACVLVLALAGAALAGGPDLVYDLSWNTIDGGGQASSGGSYGLQGTIGQPDAGPLISASYALSGGFWFGGQAPALQFRLYLPVALYNAAAL